MPPPRFADARRNPRLRHYKGKQEISAWLKSLKGVDAQSEPQASSERASWKAQLDAGGGKQEMKLSALIRQGKVQFLTVSAMK